MEMVLFIDMKNSVSCLDVVLQPQLDMNYIIYTT